MSKVYSYTLDQSGFIVGEFYGEPIDGMFQSLLPVDRNTYKIVDGALVYLPLRKYAQISDGRVVSIMEFRRAPVLAMGIALIDITDMSPQPEYGWRYDNGVFARQTFTLEETKARKSTELYNAFIADCYGILWSSATGARRGYDGDKDSIIDFLSAKARANDAKREWLSQPVETRGVEPTVNYKVWFEDGHKELIAHTSDMFDQVLKEGSVKQLAAYDKLKSLLAALQVEGDIVKVNAMSWNN